MRGELRDGVLDANRPKDTGLVMANTSVSVLMHPRSVCSSSTRSDVSSRYCSAAASTAASSDVGGHGFVRKRKICPWLTAATAESRSVWPVRRIRTASGTISRARLRNAAPFMPGMRMSEMTTAVEVSRCSVSSAAMPFKAVTTS